MAQNYNPKTSSLKLFAQILYFWCFYNGISTQKLLTIKMFDQILYTISTHVHNSCVHMRTQYTDTVTENLYTKTRTQNSRLCIVHTTQYRTQGQNFWNRPTLVSSTENVVTSTQKKLLVPESRIVISGDVAVSRTRERST